MAKVNTSSSRSGSRSTAQRSAVKSKKQDTQTADKKSARSTGAGDESSGYTYPERSEYRGPERRRSQNRDRDETYTDDSRRSDQRYPQNENQNYYQNQNYSQGYGPRSDQDRGGSSSSASYNVRDESRRSSGNRFDNDGGDRSWDYPGSSEANRDFNTRGRAGDHYRGVGFGDQSQDDWDEDSEGSRAQERGQSRPGHQRR